MTKDLIKLYNIKAKKSLWQNFLFDDNVLDKIVNYTNIFWENIIEVWPWFWALTQKLSDKDPKTLRLIELDNDMIDILEKRKILWDFKNTDIEIINKDILKYFPDLNDYKVIANIPYYITSPIINHFLYEQEHLPKEMIILMQKDVWDKILAWNFEDWKKKTKTSVLSLLISKKYYTKKIIDVSKECFSPKPKVESIVLYFEKHNLFSDISDDTFLDTIKIWFKEARKKLIKNLWNLSLKKEELLKVFDKLEIDESARAEDLDIYKWINLVNSINPSWREVI